MRYPKRVKLVEVGPRDGLQNEPTLLAAGTKVEFIDRLSETGLPVIEAASFVDPKAVPQLADAEEVFARIERKPSVQYPVLLANHKGLERALSVDARAIAVFTAATETFSQKNSRCSIVGSVERLAPVIAEAREQGLAVRAYVSCAFGCPYEGAVAAETVAQLAGKFYRLGCAEIALGDTVGLATPLQAREVFAACAGQVPSARLALHFHDTRGQALANILACLDLGAEVVDASVAGLGGCPYAPGASGNVATEDVVYMLRGMGIETGIDLDKLMEAGRYICAQLGRENQSRVSRAIGQREVKP
ncbi:MAG: hydroxymethylglutaryl-CoA lyase [Rhodospirillales bacterium]|nr:hydroxymethylglutaryl-CoA lyase [Rhodospirillales bacterium]